MNKSFIKEIRWIYKISALFFFLIVLFTSSHIFAQSNVDSTQSLRVRAKEFIQNYWEEFPFQDTVFLKSKQAEAKFADYIVVLSLLDTSDVSQSFDDLIKLSKLSLNSYNFVLYNSEKYLSNTQSPLYNEPLYILFLERVLSDDHLDEYQKSPIIYSYNLLKKNRVGYKAENFSFTTFPDKKRMDLSDYLRGSNHSIVLFFYDPDCLHCKEELFRLQYSPKINSLISQNRLSVMMIYPFENSSLWKSYQTNIPSGWLSVIADPEVKDIPKYDLSQFPVVLLLDSGGVVILKNVTSSSLINYLIDNFN